MENLKYLFLLLLTYGYAHAETEVKTLGDLDRLQAGRVYWEAQAAYNKAKYAAGNPEAVSVAAPPASTVPGSPVSSSVAPAQASPINTLPVLEKVAGAIATLSFSDGSSSLVKTGDSVQGGFTVKSITLRGVVIRRTSDGREFTLN